MDFLDFVPANIFEALGTMAGLTSCAVIAVQLIKEWHDKKPSSLAMIYTVGWLLVFVFWTLYGIRFRALAIWLTNAIAFALQLGLLIIVLNKKSAKETVEQMNYKP